MLKQQNHDDAIRSPATPALTGQPQNISQLGRRTFLKRVGLGAAMLPGTSLLMSRSMARGDSLSGGLSKGDAAILSLLAAAEILETDAWQQYQEISLGNLPFIQAIQALDGDMPTHV